mgnify:CR=1 FL=1
MMSTVRIIVITMLTSYLLHGYLAGCESDAASNRKQTRFNHW